MSQKLMRRVSKQIRRTRDGKEKVFEYEQFMITVPLVWARKHYPCNIKIEEKKGVLVIMVTDDNTCDVYADRLKKLAADGLPDTRSKIINRIDLGCGGSGYRLLEELAAKLGVTLPEKIGRKKMSDGRKRVKK